MSREIIDVKSKSLSKVPAWGNKKKYIAVHYLGVVGQNNALSSGGYGTQYYIYWDGTIYQACDHDAVTWQVGTAGYYTKKHPDANNYNTIGIEMCVKCDGDKSKADDPYWYFTEETQEACVWLVQKIMEEENIPIENVLRHHDIVNKYCPSPYVTNGKYKTNWTWDEFKAKVANKPVLEPVVPKKELYRVRKNWNDADSQIGAFAILENAIKACIEGYTVYDENGHAVHGANYGKEDAKELYRVRRDWEHPETQIGAFAELENAKAACVPGYKVFDCNGNIVYENNIVEDKEEEKVEIENLYLIAKDINDESSYIAERYENVEEARKNCPLGYAVYDWSGNIIYRNFGPEPVPTPPEELYRVRKSWEDAPSQIGAFKDAQNAINACAPGYKVFDWNGYVIYDNDKAIPDDRLYRVRQTWDNEYSLIDAYPNLETAKANCPIGYHVYDDHGTIVYTAEENPIISVLAGASKEEFIEYVGIRAQKDMERSGILASITIAQAILESGWGQSELGLKANNLFGMKTKLSGNTWKSDWKGRYYTKNTTEEYEVGKITVITADFRAYDTIDESIKDHSDYLTQAKNGNKLRYDGLVGEVDYKVAIQIIKDGGYATSSTYVEKIINLIEKYELYEWDILEDEPTPEEPPVEIPEEPDTPEAPPVEIPEEPTPEEPDGTDETLTITQEEYNTLSSLIKKFLKWLSKFIKITK